MTRQIYERKGGQYPFFRKELTGFNWWAERLIHDGDEGFLREMGVVTLGESMYGVRRCWFFFSLQEGEDVFIRARNQSRSSQSGVYWEGNQVRVLT